MGLRRRRRKIVSEQPHLESVSASNGIVSFSTDFEAPIDKIVIPISPKQDLHGYDHPWPAGGDVNLSDYTNSENWRFASSPTQRAKTRSGCTITSSSGVLTMTRNSNLVGLSIILGTLSGGIQYTLSYIATNTDNFAYIAKLDTEIADNYTATRVFTLPATTVGNAKSVTFTPEDDGIYEVLLWSLNSSNITLQKLMLQKGETATSYRPYANICPIEGHDGCEIERAGKNLVPDFNGTYEYWLKGWLTSTGDILNSSTPYITSKFIKIKAGSSYIFSANVTSTNKWKGHAFYDEEKKLIAGTYKETYIGTAPENAKYIRISLGVNHSGTTPLPTTVQLELGSTATDYEPYQGTTLPLIFNQAGDHAFLPIQEGTGDPSPENERPIHPGLTFTRDDDSVLSVYGGSLTVNADGTGSISSKWGSLYLTGEEDSSKYYCHTDGRGYISSYSDATLFKRSDIIISGVAFLSDKFSESKDGSFKSFPPYTGSFYSNNLFFRLFDDYQPHSVDEIKAEIVRIGGVHFYGLLVTPITYTLSVAETNRALEALGLSQHIGTIYGGTVTLNADGSVDLASTHFIKDLSTGSISKYGTGMFILGLAGVRSDGFAASLSDLYGYASDAFSIGSLRRASSFQGNTLENNTIYQRRTYDQLWIKNPDNLSVSEFKEYLSGKHILLDYDTPQTYHFDSIAQLKTFLGENNIWIDQINNFTLRYWKKD